MPKRRKHGEEATDATGEDRISALPDAILQAVLSFLPLDEAWETGALSWRWRHLWKSAPAPALRIVHTGVTYWNVKEMNNLVNYLLLLRDRSPLHECEISYCDPCGEEEHAEVFRFFGMWINYAVSLCQAQVLKVRICNVGVLLKRGNSALVSQFLRRVELAGVILWERAIDFSGCPKLEDLDLCYCTINGRKISSQSVRRLSITGCAFNLESDSRIRISAPCLVSLQLDGVRGGVPFLESMPSLVTAFIRLGGCFLDSCFHEDYRDCDECLAYDDHGNGCVLLQGLSGTTSLELITTHRDVFIFRKDLKQCPTFSMLKTLLLNEWCVEADFDALAYFLQHTPVLEKLVLQLKLQCNEIPNFMTKTYESCYPTIQFSVLKHLKVVEIRCHKEDEVVLQIVKILSTFGVSSDQIDVQVIKCTYYSQFSSRFSFEQTLDP